MEEQLNHYIRTLQRMRTASGTNKYPDASLHRAPHKPLLMLVVLDLAAEGSLQTNLVALTPELGEMFVTYWKLVMPPDRVANLSLPFFHMKNDGFWHLIPYPGQESVLEAIRQIAGMAELRRTVIGAQLDEGLYQLICAEGLRNALRSAIIQHYFHPAVHERLLEQGQVNMMAFQYSQALLTGARSGGISTIQDADQKPAVRDQGFRRAIVTAYDHRCVLCGIRLLTNEGLTVVNAAHIVPWSVSHNDDPRNGLCLCRLCHWVFDVGLASINSQYRVRLSDQMSALDNRAGYLTTLDSRPIFEPIEPTYNPDVDALEWHRDNVFLG